MLVRSSSFAALPLWVVLVCAFATSGCRGEPATAPPGERRPVTLADGALCYEETVFRDVDGDGFGVTEDSRVACLADDAELSGYARADGDCEPEDPQVHAGADEICGDNLDENCLAGDEACPESQEAGIAVPQWDCATSPPSSVFAWARFDEVNDYYRSGACFFFFEGLPGEFYVKPVNLEATEERASHGPDGACEAVEGCICPSIENWSYDRGRLYALTLSGEPEECQKIVVNEELGDGQVVSNSCRKFLYQIWFNPNDISFVAESRAKLERRLSQFDTLEIACFEGQPFDDLPFVSLLTTPIELNPAFSSMATR